MTAPPLLIVTCPGRTLEAVRAEVQQARDGGADIAEVRIDRLPQHQQEDLGQLFPSPLPLLAALRSTTEGGEGPEDPVVRGRLLRAAHRLGFHLLDLELERDGPLVAEFSDPPRSSPRLVLSAHLPDGVPTAEIRRVLERARPPGAVVKVVLPCSYPKLWGELLPELSPFDDYAPYVLHTTGPTGPLLRAWAGRLGMYAVYSAPPEQPPGIQPAAVEPTQIPVDRLRRYVSGGAHGPLFGVTGHPVLHSRSPAIHSLWCGAESRHGLYLALDTPTGEDFAQCLAPLSERGFRGLNVTHPWKQIALSVANRAGPAAESAGCANTLTFDPDGITADNTDVAAVRRRLTELRASGVWDDSPVVVLGAGGAARSTLSALGSLGGAGVVRARRSGAVEPLVRDYGATMSRERSHGPARLVVHATPAGREGEAPLSFDWHDLVGPGTHVLDFVYAPANPYLRQEAEARGATYEDGSRLLVYQAAESYGIWWGSAPSAELQDRALREVMCAA